MSGFDASRLDKLVHAPIRLAAVSALYSGRRETFSSLKKITGATDGNLTVHLQVLEQNGLIKVSKKFVGRRPQTSYRLTSKGRQVFRRYVANMAKMVEEFSE
ncbi:MAG: winged helix-turn-helix domain-containing protein [Planctomycetota bacterium]|jgi:DNA-binding PadR family transcriptional regulator